jgi:hypothetical protein
MSRVSGLLLVTVLGVGGMLVSPWTHASRARRGVPVAAEVGSGSGARKEESPTFEVLGFRLNRLWIPYWPCSPRTVHESSGWSAISLPENPRLEDLESLNHALACRDPLPPGFSTPSHEKRALARTTGAVDWFGRHEIQLRVTDGLGRLASAKLYLDDALVSEATVENGRIVDRGDESEAALEFFLPWIPHFTVTLITDDWDGKTEESSYSIGARH